MTDKKDKALKLALKALKTCDGGASWSDPYQRFDKKLTDKAITAIDEALAEQPAQHRHISYVCPQCYWSLEEQPASKPWVGLNDDDLDGYAKSNVLMVRHFERVLFERNTQPCLEGLPEPIRTPPEKGTEYWTIGLGRWTWGGTTHDYSSLVNGIWRCEADVWKVHAAIRRALGIESNIAAVFQNRHEAKLREKNSA